MKKNVKSITKKLAATIAAGALAIGLTACGSAAGGADAASGAAGGEELTLNKKGESVISYADYAIAMVDELEKGDHIGQRISVARE